MRRALARWAADFRSVSGGTGRTWLACLPELLFSIALGQLAYHGMLLAASFTSGRHPWVALVMVSLGFAGLLVAYLHALRALGRHLGVPSALASGRDEDDDPAGPSLTHLVAATLLPFLGIYAVFGKVEDTSRALYTYETIIRGLYSASVLTQLNPRTQHQMVVIAAVLVGAYLVRRGLDISHERTGVRLLGVLTGIVETFFMLVLIFGGTNMIGQAKNWLATRQVTDWTQSALGRAAAALRRIHHLLPEWIVAVWQWFWGPAWHAFLAGLASPLLWLAIAALAMGSQISSLSEVWRSTIGARVKLPAAGGLADSPWGKAGAEFKELFLGDIDDKYLPTWHSLRLVLASGASLVGVFCLLHAVASLAGPAVWWLARQVIGPREPAVWIQVGVALDVLAALVMEPLRLSLLAVTFRRCVQTVRARSTEEMA